MANRNEKNEGNVPGPFYVDSSCIDCDLCRESAPAIFRRNDEIGFSIAYRQPVTPEEIAQATQAMNGCPTESIGNDGAEPGHADNSVPAETIPSEQEGTK